MKNIFNKKYFSTIFILLTVFFMFGNTVFAKLSVNPNDDSTLSTIGGTLQNIVNELGKLALGISTAGLASLISGLAFVLFLVLQTIFAATDITNDIFRIPFPDQVVFNRVELLDANFINPESGSPIFALKNTIAGVYDSFIIIAIAFFTIIAMIIGIKLALASIASQKAQYKQAIGYWITGILLVVCLKWVLAGMFKINEAIVQMAYDISRNTDEMGFQVLTLSSLPFIGNTLSTIMGWFGKDASATAIGDPVPGYLGLVLKYMFEGLGGNFVGSLVAIVVLGQTISIIATYLKRVFYCLLLGIIGPLIIAVDTLNRSLGKGTKILSNWLKQLAVTIFTQSFHAIFMVILLKFMIEIGNVNLGSSYLESIIIIILTTGLIKFEKLIKQLFGVSDGIMGDLKGGAMQAMATMGAMTRAAKSVGDNGKKLKAAKGKKSELLATKARLESRQAMYDKMGSGINSLTSSAKASNPAPATTQSSANSLNAIHKQQLLSEATMASANADKLKMQAKNKLEMAKSIGNSPNGGSQSDSAKRDQRISLLNEAGELRRKAMEQQEIAKKKTNLANSIKVSEPSSGAEHSQTEVAHGVAQGGAGADDEIKSILRNINQQMLDIKKADNDAELRKVNAQLGEAEADIASAKFAKSTGALNTLVGLGIGLGADNLAAGATVTTLLDHTAEKIGRRGADEARSRMYDEDGQSNPEILRKKPVTKKVVQDVLVDVVTQKTLRETVNVIRGKSTTNSSKSSSPDISEYKYKKDRNNRGHSVISENVDNL